MAERDGRLQGVALSRGGKLLRFGDRGFAVAQAGYGVWLLAARDEEAAAALLWQAIDTGDGADRPCVGSPPARIGPCGSRSRRSCD